MNSRRYAIALFCLTGCSGSRVEDAVKDHFPDPKSVEIRQVAYSRGGKFACADLKTTHRGGRFPGRTAGYLIKTNGKWSYAHDFSETHDECVSLINSIDPAPRT